MNLWQTGKWVSIAACAVFLSLNVQADSTALKAVVDNKSRTAAAKARDEFRHPLETLSFFDVRPEHRVLEVWPGAGWYSEILAPYLSEHGELVAGHFNPDSSVGYFVKSRASYQQRLTENPTMYSKVKLAIFDPENADKSLADGSFDRVLTFRNMHNFYMNGGGDEAVQAAFKVMYDSLKSGGILGVVEHRLPIDKAHKLQESSGYLHEKYVIAMAEAVGFKLQARSEINANAKDLADHPKGVWSLPPSYALGDDKRDYFHAIGESDRMTLKFIKP